MKTVICLSLMAFLIFSGCSKVDNGSAEKPDDNQLKAAPKNGSVSWYYSGGYGIPLVCDDVQVGYISGWPVDWHVIDHYKNGEIEWSIYKASGSLTLKSTGEVFEIQESDKIFYSKGNFSFHANLVGNQGSHYILSGNFDPITYEVFVEKAVCPNGPKN